MSDAFNRLDEVTRHLRVECPWDREQTHASLARHAIEECYELVDAIEEWSEGDQVAEDHLIEELGDVLVQVFVHAAIGAQTGRFTADDVAKRVTDKLIERHPHVYGDVAAESSAEVMSNWEAAKKKTKGRASVMDGIPSHLPSLLMASKVLRKAAHSGIETEVAGDGIGARLFALVNESRRSGIEPETALRAEVAKFRDRFEAAERAAAADGIELTEAGRELAMRYWEATADLNP